MNPTLTPEQQKRYETVLPYATSPEEAYRLVTGFGDPIEQQRAKSQGVLQALYSSVSEPLSGLGQGIAGAIGQSAIQRQSEATRQQAESIAQQLLTQIRSAQNRGDTATAQRLTNALQTLDYGAGVQNEFVQNLPSNREVISSAIQTGAAIAGLGITGGTGSLLSRTGNIALREAGAGAAFGLGQGIGDTEAGIGDIAGRTATGALIGGAVGAAFPLSGAAISRLTSGAQQGARNLRDMVRRPAQEGSSNPISETIETLQETFIPGRRAEGVIERARTSGVESIDESVLRTAISRGFDESDAILFSSLSGKDKDAARKMFQVTEQVQSNPLSTARAADVIGEGIVRPIEELRGLERQAGREVDLAAKSLKGETVNAQNIESRINQVLEEAGISGNPTIWNFSGSRFEFVPEVQDRIAKTLDNVYLALQDGDAFAIHNLKKAIDEAVDYAKKQEGLTGSGQSLIKSIRRAIDDELDTQFPSYNESNSRFSDLRSIIEDTETIFGSGEKINAARANNLVRSLFSNNMRRGEVELYLDRLNKYLDKYNIEKPGNLVAQFRFAEALEKMYGTQAVTSLQGEVQKAIRGARTIANIARDPLRGAGEVLAGGIETITGQTDAARRAFLRDLFSSP